MRYWIVMGIMNKKEFPELTEMHRNMCHLYFEESKANPDGERRGEIMKDIEEFERMVFDYTGAKMKGYKFMKYE